MAIVSLKRDWFDGNGKYWHARDNPHEMSDELAKTVPSSAVLNDSDDVNALKEKEREEDLVQKAESEENDKKHAAVVTKTATPVKR